MLLKLCSLMQLYACVCLCICFLCLCVCMCVYVRACVCVCVCVCLFWFVCLCYQQYFCRTSTVNMPYTSFDQPTCWLAQGKNDPSQLCFTGTTLWSLFLKQLHVMITTCILSLLCSRCLWLNTSNGKSLSSTALWSCHCWAFCLCMLLIRHSYRYFSSGVFSVAWFLSAGRCALVK